MSIPSCHLLTMSIIKPTLKINVFKMEQTFFIGYWKDEKMFYIFFTQLERWRRKGEHLLQYFEFVWKEKNVEFKKLLVEDPHMCWLSWKMFHIWDGNHRLQAWWPYIDLNHPNETKWQVKVDSFVLDTTNGLVELLITMTNINKWDFILTIHSCFQTCQIVLCWWLTIFLRGRSIEMDHVKPSVVHDFFYIQSIKMIPLH
jgi:hypothetical protein